MSETNTNKHTIATVVRLRFFMLTLYVSLVSVRGQDLFPKVRFYPMSRFSVVSLYKATWSITVVYYSLLIAEITKEGIVPFVINYAESGIEQWLVFPTLILFLTSAFEDYIWLNESKNINLNKRSLIVSLTCISIYIISVIIKAFLLIALTNDFESSIESILIWSSSFGAIMILYALYNLISILDRDHQSRDDREEAIKAFGFYFLFAFIFFFAFFIRVSDVVILYLIAAFLLYIISYMVFWKDWFARTLSHEEGRSHL